MTYIVELKNGNAYTFSDDDGESLKTAWLEAKTPFKVDLGDAGACESSSIRSIRRQKGEPGQSPAKERDDPNRCRGKRSIQFEIMKLIKKKYPTDWPKYFRNKAYKEKLRLWLREKSEDEWCDAVAGTCVCTSDYVPDPGRLKAVLEMFPGAEPIAIKQDDRKDLE